MIPPGARRCGPPLGVRAASFFSTHHESAAALLAGEVRAPALPSFPLLEGRARRFTSLVTQLHMEVCGALHGQAPVPPCAVFATRHGEVQTGAKLIVDFRDTDVVSSARFALSVHNSPSGLYSVATGSDAPTTTITGSNMAATSWLVAALQVADGAHVLLSLADEPVPAELHGPAGEVGYAAGFLLGPEGGAPCRAELWLCEQPAPPPASDDEVARVLAKAVLAARAPGAAQGFELGALGPEQTLWLVLTAPEAA